MSKISKILADAAVLAEKIQIEVKNDRFSVIEHCRERFLGGSQPDLSSLAVSQGRLANRIHGVFIDFLKGLDLSEVLSDKGALPDQLRQVTVIGKPPHVLIYVKEDSPEAHLKDYLERVGVDGTAFVADDSYEVMEFHVDQLVAREVYEIAGEGSFHKANKAELVARIESGLIRRPAVLAQTPSAPASSATRVRRVTSRGKGTAKTSKGKKKK